MLKVRILSALVIAPVFYVALVYFNALFFCAFWGMIVLFAAREWARFVQLDLKMQWGFAAVVSVLSALMMYILPRVDPMLVAMLLSAVALFWLAIVPLWLRFYARTEALPIADRVLLVVGAIVLLAFAMAVKLIWQRLGGLGLMGLFVIVWSADIGAYFCGKSLGKVALAPTISPKKTREGFWGGVAVALLAAFVFVWLTNMARYQWFFIIYTSVVVVYATLGDLFESALKRRCGLKDSSQLIPGHGGMMDRIDSWLPSIVLWATWFALADFL